VPAIRRGLLLLMALAGLGGSARAADRYFQASDGVTLHYIEEGSGNRTIVFIPGWTMPAWIFELQIRYFSKHYHVIALDPRGQGLSQIAAGGYNQSRRGYDIADLMLHLGPKPVLLVGWSLGVLDSLAYVHLMGPGRLAGLVLIDNSVGENPPPAPERPRRRSIPLPWDREMGLFVRSMFAHSPGEEYLDQLTLATLVTPPWAARALLAYPVPRTYWRNALYTVTAPILYVVNPRFKGQAANVALHDSQAECVVFTGTGHALFIDAPDRFNQTMQSFITNKIWP
jgi:microsomal epoxide hydrolase